MSNFAIINDAKASPATQESLSQSKKFQQNNKLKKQDEGLYALLIEGLNSSSRRLDIDTAGYFESRFGHKFANIRIHDNSEAAESANTLHADAYTFGNDIIFAKDKYRPGTFQGDLLLAHELVHTLQQKETQIGGSMSEDIVLSNQSDQIESEAASLAPLAASKSNPSPIISSKYPTGKLMIARQQATFQDAKSFEEIAEPNESIVGGIIANLQEDPEDRRGAVRRKLEFLPDPVIQDVLQRLNKRLSPEQRTRLSAIVAKPTADPTLMPKTQKQYNSSQEIEDRPQSSKSFNGGADKAGMKSDSEAKTQEPSEAIQIKEITEGKTKANVEAERVIKFGKTDMSKTDVISETDKGAKVAEGATEMQSVADIDTGNLALIDEELAEHQRWGVASAMVGTAGSEQRAEFLAQTAATGAMTGLTEGITQGLKMGAGMKIAEKIAEKGAIKLATSVGAQAAKFTPLPAVGAVIGGAMSAYELASRDWKTTGETIGRFGEGASIYDELANSIEAISTIIEVATQVLNVIAGVVGVISIAMWIITVLTAGIASPLAATLSAIAAGIGLATMILDGINALVLKQLITMFRALHSFTSQADPRDVMVQSNAIRQAASAGSGFLGGLGGGIVGGSMVEEGFHSKPSKEPSTPIPDHQSPSAASGDGPTVKAEPLIEANASNSMSETADVTPTGETQKTPSEPMSQEITPVYAEEGAASKTSAESPISPKPQAEGPSSSKSGPDLNEASFSELNDVIKELDEGSFGDKLQTEAQQAQQPPPTAPSGTRWGRRGYSLLRRLLLREQSRPPGTQAQHWTKWLASTEDLPVSQRMTPEMISENRSWLQTDPNSPATLLLSGPQGTRYFIGDQPAPIGTSPQLELPGFDRTTTTPRYTTEHRFADNYLIPEAADRIRRINPSANANQVNLWAGAEARWRMEGVPGQGDWGWQPGSTARIPVQLPLLSEIGPQIPRSTTTMTADPLQLSFDFNKPSPSPTQLDLFSQPDYKAQEAMASSQMKIVQSTPEPQSKLPMTTTENESKLPMTTAENEKNLQEIPEDHRDTVIRSLEFLPDQAKQDFLQRQNNESIIEHVNPDYPSPPGTPQDLVNIQNQILETLDARAKAEDASHAMAGQEIHHKANEKPLTNMQKGTEEAISSTEAHKQAVARREEANKQKNEKEEQASGTLADYSNRAAKLATITIPMRGFERFTSLAYSLPDSPDVLQGAKRGILKMNADSRNFLNQLDRMDNTINAQKASQGDRNNKTQADSTLLNQTDNNAKESDQTFKQTKQTCQDLDLENKSRLDQATKLRINADQTSASLDTQAQQKQAEARSLAESLQIWAQNHKQARLDALEQTKKQIEQRRYKVTDVKER